MFKSFLIIIFVINFQSLAKAEKITDFEVEGITVGDSLLLYMNKDDIKNNDLNYYSNDSKFTAINFIGKKDTYEYVIVYIKRNDSDYKIHLIRAINLIKGKNDCIKSKKIIEKEMKSLFKKATFQEGSQKHYHYKKSTQYISQFYYGTDGRFSDGARVECLILDEDDKKEFEIESSTLEVIVQYGGEFGRWLETQ
jgi:hypothetical protein|tara:strand:- start:290 stop:874 length:585 start_codon:yes stop_codon:yes gene_type:complete